MSSIGKWFAESIRLSRSLLIEQRTPLFCLFALSCFLNITTQDAMQLMGAADDGQRWYVQLGAGLWDLLEGILLLLILSWGIPKVRQLTAATLLPKPFSEAYLGSFLAEYLRVLAQVLMWALLLLLPGFYRYCQLIFVPMIVLFSRAYRTGDVDALRLSERLAKGRLMRILLALGLTMFLQIGFDFLPELVPAFHSLALRVAFDGLSFLASVWAFALIFVMFEAAMEDVSLENL